MDEAATMAGAVQECREPGVSGGEWISRRELWEGGAGFSADFQAALSGNAVRARRGCVKTGQLARNDAEMWQDCGESGRAFGRKGFPEKGLGDDLHLIGG
ncbi:hypothetical protein [Tabrizicola sp. TH137]|uniref:hypothetical protein n=1 Tax=Tabrizicola sp. TH137 TaxID=2067452 RepID=UPI00117DC2E4|nr:hypothetical protein [Tabrizicola sp. TH137]